jgi:hypothetical protein
MITYQQFNENLQQRQQQLNQRQREKLQAERERVARYHADRKAEADREDEQAEIIKRIEKIKK